MRPIAEDHLQSILNNITVLYRTTDRSEYAIPKDKLLLLDWGTEIGHDVTIITDVMVQDGAGVDGNQQLLELSDEDDIVFDAFFDDCPFDLKKRLKLIDNPFA